MGDESVVVLCRKIQCNLTDILYVRSKVNTKLHTSFDQEPAKIQEAAAQYINGSADAKLYYLANERLDKLIAEVGDSFKVDLARFHQMLAVVADSCTTNKNKDCMWGNNGCGQECIDDLVVQNGWL